MRPGLKRYVLVRHGLDCRPTCTVEWADSRYRLRWLTHHSPTGIEWGYGGSGPSDLARSIVGDLLGTVNPDPAVYQRVKWDLIAGMPPEGGVITEEQLLNSIAAAAHA